VNCIEFGRVEGHEVTDDVRRLQRFFPTAHRLAGQWVGPSIVERPQVLSLGEYRHYEQADHAHSPVVERCRSSWSTVAGRSAAIRSICEHRFPTCDAVPFRKCMEEGLFESGSLSL